MGKDILVALWMGGSFDTGYVINVSRLSLLVLYVGIFSTRVLLLSLKLVAMFIVFFRSGTGGLKPKGVTEFLLSFN